MNVTNFSQNLEACKSFLRQLPEDSAVRSLGLTSRTMHAAAIIVLEEREQTRLDNIINHYKINNDCFGPKEWNLHFGFPIGLGGEVRLVRGGSFDSLGVIAARRNLF